METNLQFRSAANADAPLLARLNRQLQEDERHHNIMEIAAIETRMQQWLAAEVYLDALVKNVSGLAFWRAIGFTDYCITMERHLPG